MNTINNTYKRIIVRVLSGEASAAEKERLDLWLSRSEEHRRLYKQFKKIWELEPETHADTEFDTQRALNRVLDKIQAGETEKQPAIQSERKLFINSPKNLYWLSGIAAAFFILITTSLFFFLRSPEAEMLTLVADQEDQLLTLDDGSRIHLRAGASLYYPEQFKGNKRQVNLTGSAFFEIETDNQRPFVIKTGQVTIEVLGTSFYVDATDDHMTVFVSEGMVRLQSNLKGGPEAIISKGESGIFIYDQQKIQKRSFENMNFLAWKTGKLEFNNEPLSGVFMALEEAYKISVKAPDAVMDKMLTARFQDETPEDVLKSICLVFGFEVSVNNNEYTINVANQDIK